MLLTKLWGTVIIFKHLRECWNGRQARLRCVWLCRVGSSPISRTNKKVPFVYQTKGTFLRDAFLAERDAHYVRDAGFARDARLRRVGRTHRITDHSAAASLITYLQTYLICDIM